ncbi:unnamed protein product, partial [Rotaria sp. Silwood1]
FFPVFNLPRLCHAVMLNQIQTRGAENATQTGTRNKFLRHFKTLVFLIWPHKHIGLQLNILVCIAILATGRLLVLGVPRYVKLITDELVRTTNGTVDMSLEGAVILQSPDTWPWRLIAILMVLRFLQGGSGAVGSGLLEIGRTILWTKIEQYMTRTLKLRVLSHLHHLSLHWHLSRKTGEVLRIVDRVDWINQLTVQLVALIQLLIICIGLTVGSLYITWLIGMKYEMTIGDYILFGLYMTQLNAPLILFGRYYRLVRQALTDMENMLDLLDITPDVQDSPVATDICINNGMIEFDNICFRYKSERPILKNVTFNVLPGQTVAIVGPSGAGKSTIIRLLFRFYDVESGSIKIDGIDISTVTQRSLRLSIGVVPQDTVLFNKDILYNIRYGRVTATDREVENVAQTAEMHDRISTFPNGYKTLVGERGLKLSGGEIIERGSHDELLAINNGIYASMWKEQLNFYSEADMSTTSISTLPRIV